MEKKIETLTEYCERMLTTVAKLLRQFGKLLETEQKSGFDSRFEALSTDAAFGEKPDVATVKALRDQVVTAVTLARVNQIRSFVERKVQNWSSSRFGDPFSTTSAATSAAKWLEGVGSTSDNRAVMAWIDEGWSLLKGSLESPWGKCACGRNLVPVSITDRVSGQKSWRTFRQCQVCYSTARDSRDAVSAATRGHKVAKPGSASRRSDGPRPASSSRKPFKKGQKNK